MPAGVHLLYQKFGKIAIDTYSNNIAIRKVA